MPITAADFVRALFGPTTEGPVYLSSLPNDRDNPSQPGERRLVSRETSEIDDFVRRWDRSGRGMFFAVGTVQGKRSKATMLESIGLHADIDFKNVAASEDEIWKAIKQLRCQPSAIVRSGHGVHLYWLLHEGLPTPEHLDRLEAALHLLADHVAGDPAVCEVARLMRLPGTHNTKNGEWTEVVCDYVDGPRYELEELVGEWLERDAPVLRRKPVAGKASADLPENHFTKMARQLGFKPPVDVEQRLAAMTYGGAGENGIHQTQLSVSASLLNKGTTVEEIIVLLMGETQRAAGDYAARWNWQREERNIRGMCATWLAQHPVAPQRQRAVSRAPTVEHNPETGEVVDLSAARAKRQAPPKQASQKKHIVLAETVMAVVQDRGERIMFTTKGLYRYVNALWCLVETDKEFRSWLDAELEAGAKGLSFESNTRLINEARAYIMRQPHLRVETPAFDAHRCVPTLSGLVDPRTGVVTPALPEHYCTWRIEAHYRPDAVCPLWRQMLNDTFIDRPPDVLAATIRLLQEVMGAGLIDDRPKALSRAQIFVGGSDFGKSSLINVWAGLFGDECNATPLDRLDGTHALMQFARRVPWVLHEAFEQSQWHMSSTVKALVSGDPVQINVKGGAIFAHRFTGPIIWGTNNPPQFKEATDAVVNRFVITDCRHKFDVKSSVGVALQAKNEGLSEPHHLVLRDEIEGLLVWAVEGLRRALARGHFLSTEETLTAAEHVRRDSNIVLSLVRDCTVYDPDMRISVADFAAAHRFWWIENKDPRAPHGRVVIGRAMRALHDDQIACDETVRDNSTRYYAGIAFNEEGMRLWTNARQSQSFEFRDRLLDATPVDGNPNDPIPMSWNDRPSIIAMREAQDRCRAGTKKHPAPEPFQSDTSSPSDDGPTRGRDRSPDPSSDPSFGQPLGFPRKPLL